jgi:hypothetical protein
MDNKKFGRDSDISTCILCSRKGHSVQGHDCALHPKSFPNGNPFWAKKKAGENRSLYDNTGTKEICINYNYANAKKTCTHDAGARLHVCSFCGGDHPALSYKCRSQA